MTRSAWFCPACQKHHAPHVETCPRPVDAISTTPMPTYPFPGSTGDVPFRWDPNQCGSITIQPDPNKWVRNQ